MQIEKSITVNNLSFSSRNLSLSYACRCNYLDIKTRVQIKIRALKIELCGTPKEKLKSDPPEGPSKDTL